MTKDPETQEFMTIIQFADQGNLRHVLSNNFNDILWKDKIKLLWHSAIDLSWLHSLGYFHKDFHSGNMLRNNGVSYSRILNYLGHQVNRNPTIKYVEYYRILLQKF